MKNTNPLYHVNKENIVEEASSYINLILKKLGLESVVLMFNNLINQLLSQFNPVVVLEALKKWLSEIIFRLQALVAGGVGL
jgi:Mg2+/Co2+ transporter CorB